MADVQHIITNNRVHPGNQVIAQLEALASVQVAGDTFPTWALARWQLEDVADRLYPTLLTRCARRAWAVRFAPSTSSRQWRACISL
jgi:hypothetical protein